MSFLQLQRTRDRLIAAGVALALFAAGGFAMWLVVSRQEPAAPAATATNDKTVMPMPPPTAPTATDIEITLDRDAVQRIGLAYETVVMRPAARVIRVPGTVEPNAYREVLVTPLVSGRVQQVHVQLGDRVRAGQALATIFSPDLSEAQTRFLSMRAALEAESARLKRTERLVEIGAASRQELEEVRAKYTELSTEVEGARERLALLGLSRARIDALRRADQISALVAVPSPGTGEIIERAANPGLVVDQSSVMFKVSDLSRVWVIANLYERDINAIAIKDLAIVTTPALPDLRLNGRVSYLDPTVDPATRTARARIEVENPGQRLRLQMYVDVTFETERASQLPVVPASAVQRIGEQAVVYVRHPQRPDTFVERRVEVGESEGGHVQVRAGLSAGEVVVTNGSFHLRAERERTRPGEASGASALPPAPGATGAVVAPGEIAIAVTERGFEPPQVAVPANRPTKLVFTRTSDKTCATQLLLPETATPRTLPLNEPVTIELAAGPARSIAFTCGMKMFRGQVVIR